MSYIYRTDENGRDWLILDQSKITPRMINIAEIERVAKHTGVSFAKISGESRDKEIVAARWLAMYHMVEIMGLSAAEAGRVINKDRTSVIYGVAKEKYRLTGVADPILLKKGSAVSARPYAGAISPNARKRCDLAA